MRLADEIILIRHAPALTGGRLCGRMDVPLAPGAEAALARMAALLEGVTRVISSPALRCRQTAAGLFPGRDPETDPRLWEQDFGAEDGMALADLPNLGPLTRADLAARCPPDGESFAAMAARVAPALTDLADAQGRTAIVAHAGTVRAGLALALGDIAAALAFEVAPLSLTRLRPSPGGWSIAAVNVTA